MVFNATFNNISVISWLSVLLVEKTRVPGEKHRPAASHWQTWSCNVVSNTITTKTASDIYIFICIDRERRLIFQPIGRKKIIYYKIKKKKKKRTDVNIEILVINKWENIYVFHETKDQCILYLNQDNINV